MMTLFYCYLFFQVICIWGFIPHLLLPWMEGEENSEKKGILGFILGLIFFPAMFVPIFLLFGFCYLCGLGEKFGDKFPKIATTSVLVFTVGLPLSMIWMISGNGGQ